MALPTPVAYWPFDEGTGTTSTDASGNGHTATLVNATWDTSALKKFGVSALKNTTGRGASITSFNIGIVHSVGFWINGWDGTTGSIILGGNSDSYICYINATNFYYSNDGTTDAVKAHSSLTGSHHIVITRNGTTVTWYVDGTSLGSSTLPNNSAFVLDSISGRNANTYPFVATIDDLRVYDVELTSSQATELFNLTPVPPVAASVRATQLVAEVITQPTPTARASQVVAEVLFHTASVSARSSQVAVEVLTKNVLEKIKNTPPGRGNATSTTVTFTPAPALNNGVVILVHGYDASAGAVFGPSACTDNQGNTYTLAITQQNVANKNAVAIYYCPQILFVGTPFNITITFTATTFFTTVGAEIAGPIALDGSASNTGNATAVTTGTTAGLATNNQLITAIQSVTGASESSITVQSVTPPWFEEFEDLTWGSHLVGEADSRVISTGLGVGQACAWTNATARPYAAAIATFRIPVVVIPPTTVDDVQFLVMG